MPLINQVNIIRLEYNPLDGVPLRPPQFSEKDWTLWLLRCQKHIAKYKSDWRTVVENELVQLPRIKHRLGKNGLAKCISKFDYEKALADIRKKGLIPTHTRIASKLGICSATLKRLNARQWHLILPHAQQWRARATWRNTKGRFIKPHASPH